MVTSYQLIRFWRVIILAMLMVSFVGPWFFDVIMVPAEYECNLPFVRLDDDFCGLANVFPAILLDDYRLKCFYNQGGGFRFFDTG